MFVNTKTEEIINHAELKRRTQTSFPAVVTPEMLDGTDYAVISLTTAPTCEPDEVIEEGEYERGANEWKQTWVKRQRTFEEKVNRILAIRASEYPPLGDAADVSYKQRQKARMTVGKARAALDEGDLLSALKHLAEAIEPVEDAKDYDGVVSQVKKDYPKPEPEVT